MTGERKKVLMVGPWPPLRGGVTTFMCNVVNSSLKDKYEFIPFTTSRPAKRNMKADNYGYAAVLAGGYKRVIQGILITLWHVAIYPWVLIRRRPAIVQIQASDFQAFWEAATYVLIAKLLRCRTILRIGGSFDRFYEASGKTTRSAIRWTLKQPAVLIVQSQYWREYVAKLGRGGPIVIMNNFVPNALVEKRSPLPSRVPHFLLSCGDVPRLKGAYVLLEAVRHVLAQGVQIEVTLISTTPGLREDIRNAGLADRVHTLDMLSHDQALAALRRADVFLQISYSEGFPNMLLEAIALGCAAIVTPVGAVPEIVGEDGECAFIVPVGNASALADRIARMASDVRLLSRMANAAQTRVSTRYTEQAVVRVLDEAYGMAMSL